VTNTQKAAKKLKEVRGLAESLQEYLDLCKTTLLFINEELRHYHLEPETDKHSAILKLMKQENAQIPSSFFLVFDEK
jgi:hypothetical protein